VEHMLNTTITPVVELQSKGKGITLEQHFVIYIYLYIFFYVYVHGKYMCIRVGYVGILHSTRRCSPGLHEHPRRRSRTLKTYNSTTLHSLN
jgi:hypothetical protein